MFSLLVGSFTRREYRILGLCLKAMVGADRTQAAVPVDIWAAKKVWMKFQPGPERSNDLAYKAIN